jgi:hypothetical protein
MSEPQQRPIKPVPPPKPPKAPKVSHVKPMAITTLGGLGALGGAHPSKPNAVGRCPLPPDFPECHRILAPKLVGRSQKCHGLITARG